MYQEPAGKSLDFPKQAVGEWEEKEEEAEEVSSWENRIPWENNNYTQLLSAGRKEGGLILKELHPVSGRQFRIDKTHPTIIGQLKDQARSRFTLHSSKPGYTPASNNGQAAGI